MRYASGDGGFRLERLANGWVVGQFAALDAIGVAHCVTTRRGPDVQQVRNDTAGAGRRIAEALDAEEVAYLEQVHAGDALICERPGQAGPADGLVTVTPNLLLLGKSADCPLVLLADAGGQAVGFAHASWRATVAGIVPAVVSCMEQVGCRPDNLVACICPSVGPECYEVGAEVRDAAVARLGSQAEIFFRAGPRGRDHFDLWAANADALIRAGVKATSIHVAGMCTMCHNDLFPSYRREGQKAGRFAAVIGRMP